MRIASFFVAVALLTTSCAINEKLVENQVSVNTNQNAVTNQNANVQSVSAPNVKKEVDYFAHIKPEHREVLREWLRSKPHLRPGVEEIDNAMFDEAAYEDKAKFKENYAINMKILREAVGEKGNQYYSVADLNRDGKKDFAVILLSSRVEYDVNYFGLAIFNAPFKKGQKPAYYEEIFRGVGNSYIVFDKMIENRLYLGKFESDFYCETFYPKGKTYYSKNCFE